MVHMPRFSQYHDAVQESSASVHPCNQNARLLLRFALSLVSYLLVCDTQGLGPLRSQSARTLPAWLSMSCGAQPEEYSFTLVCTQSSQMLNGVSSMVFIDLMFWKTAAVGGQWMTASLLTERLAGQRTGWQGAVGEMAAMGAVQLALDQALDLFLVRSHNCCTWHMCSMVLVVQVAMQPWCTADILQARQITLQT